MGKGKEKVIDDDGKKGKGKKKATMLYTVVRVDRKGPMPPIPPDVKVSFVFIGYLICNFINVFLISIYINLYFTGIRLFRCTNPNNPN